MKITTDHPASIAGTPVILDDAGDLLDYKSGVQALRAALELSQSELAAKIGFSVRTIQDWELGRNNPSAAALNAMASALKPLQKKKRVG